MKDPSLPRNLLQLGAVAVITFTARASFADHYRVPTGSMEPTVHVGDHIVVSKIAYGLRVPLTDRWLASFASPQRGEVVVLDPPTNDDGWGNSDASSPGRDSGYSGEGDGESRTRADVLLKRVVALAGETVEVRDGVVIVNGSRVEERWASLRSGAGPDFGPSRIPDGKLLVLGDNRGNSRDGRYFGFVEIAQVLGRAVAVVARDGRLDYEPL